jgi:phenylacetate-CoA ligase
MIEQESTISFLPATEQYSRQWPKVEALVNYVQVNSPFYKNYFAQHGLAFNPSFTQNDFKKIPPISKEALQDAQANFLCIPAHHIAEYTATTGTLGKAVSVPLSEHDLQRLALNEEHSFELMELNPYDRVQLMLTLDRQFMAGMAYYSGLRKKGIASVRCGPALPAVQLETALQLQTSVWIAVPSFILKVLDYANAHGFDLKQLAVRKILCIGENIREEDFSLNSLGKRIIEQLPVQLFSTYASTEMQTAFTECVAGCGGHYVTDMLYAEILNEEGQEVEEGAYGELVISTLGIEAMPLIRYRTGDIVRMDSTPCACGRKSPRLSPVLGRKNQMIKYKGTTLYPPLLHHVLHDVDNVIDYLVEVRQNELAQDEVTLHLSVKQQDDIQQEALKEYLKARLRFVPKLLYKSEPEIQQLLFQGGTRKPQRFIDHRNHTI